MTQETYLRILRDRLEEIDVDEETIKRVMVREQATLSGLSDEEAEPLCTEEHLIYVVASAKKRSHIEAQNKRLTLSKSNYTVQDSQTSSQDQLDNTITVSSATDHSSDTLVPLPEKRLSVSPYTDNVVSPISKVLTSHDTATVVISKLDSPDEAETIVPVIPMSILTNDTSTIVISKITSRDEAETFVPDASTTMVPDNPLLTGTSKRNNPLIDETATVVPPPNPNPWVEDQTVILAKHHAKTIASESAIGIQLLGTETIHISDKETVEFFTDDASTIFHRNTHRSATDIPFDEEETIPSFLDKAHEKAIRGDAPESVIEKLHGEATLFPVKQEELQNHHPYVIGIMTTTCLFPLFLLVSVFFTLLTVTVYSAVWITIFLPILLYTIALSVCGGGLIYGLYSSITCLKMHSFPAGIYAGLITVTFLAALVLAFKYLHKLIIPLHTRLWSIGISFHRHIKKLIKRIRRLLVSGIRST